jgi:tight adherence protein B
MILPFLVAITVILLIWGVYQVVGGLSDERKKLSQRLSGEGKATDGFDPSSLTVVRRVQVIGGISGMLAHLPFLGGLARRITQVWPRFSLAKFIFVTTGMAALGFSIMYVVTDSCVLGGAVSVVFAAIPLIVLNNSFNRRQRDFLDQLPEALDFLSRILRAGHSLSTGLQMMADELPKPISEEFRKVYDGHSLGQPLEEALKDMSARVDSTDFSFFVTAVLIQRQTGGDLSEVLGNISRLVRSRMRLAQSVAAKTAEGRFTGYILVCFPVVMFLICWYLNPELYGGFAAASKGKWLLGTAAGLVLLGMFCIRKITTVRV